MLGLIQKFNLFLQFYILFCLFTALSDYVRFISSDTLRLYPALLLFLPLLIVIGKRKLNHSLLSRYDLLFLGLLMVIFVLRTPMPDTFWDTNNYHIGNQLSFFHDRIHYDFFPASILHSFFYPLSDSMSYVFRHLLGYRLGTALNTIVLLVIYYTVKEVLLRLTRLLHCPASDRELALAAALSVMTEFILVNIGSYGVDIFAIPLLLALVLMLLELAEAPEVTFTFYLWFSSITCLVIALKLSNLYLLLPLVLICITLLLRQKKFRFGFLCLSVLLGIIPIFPYILHNFLQTHNPFFPFYNQIFHSEYFASMNFTDTRWGPKSLLEFFLWPLLIPFHNGASELNHYTGRISIGYLACAGILALSLKEMLQGKRTALPDKKLPLAAGCFIILLYLWQLFALGYVRYMLALEVLTVILLFIVYKSIAVNQHAAKFYKYIALILYAAIMLQSMYAYYETVYRGFAWFPTYSLQQMKDKAILNNYRQDIKKIGKDHLAIKTAALPDNDYWLSFHNTYGIENLINPTIPAIRPLDEYKEALIFSSPKTVDIYHNRLNEMQNKKIYVATYTSQLNYTLEYIKKVGFEEQERTVLPSTITQAGDSITLIKVIRK